MLISLTSVSRNLLLLPNPSLNTKKPRSEKMIRWFFTSWYKFPNRSYIFYLVQSPPRWFTSSIRMLNALAQKLKAKRMAAGALNLASPEVKIHLDSSESSDPIDVEQKEMRETNNLMEEFILLANIRMARKIEETFPQTAVLRWFFSTFWKLVQS